MTIDEYIATLRGKRIAVCGIGISNRPLIRLLAHGGCSVMACDRRTREQLGIEADKLESMGVALRLGDDYLEGLEADFVFRAPSLLPHKLTEVSASGAIITSEMEVFCRLCPCKLIAVTGSDGKTTTTTLISELLKAAGYTVHIGGNIGTPLLERLTDISPDDFVVLELSSFQLHSMQCRPDVAVVTNISPNHLDIHSSYQDYLDAKKNIFRMQGSDCRLVLNADCPEALALRDEARAEIRLFSRLETVENGAFMGADMLFLTHDWAVQAVLAKNEVKLPGLHNIENLLAAFAAVDGLVPLTALRRVAREFSGVQHRMERVRELNGVTYYNDAIATSPSRAMAALHSLTRPIILIAGGKDKGIPFDEFGVEICKHVKKLVLTGATAELILNAVNTCGLNPPEAYIIHDFEAAIRKSYEIAEPGDCVTLSPGCTSFDCFPNFEVKGNRFKEIVNSL